MLNIFAIHKYVWISLDYIDDTICDTTCSSQGLLFHCFVEHIFFENFAMFFADRMFKADPFVPQHLGSSLRGGVIAR